MDSETKLTNITRIQQELHIANVRLQNAEISVQMFSDQIEGLTQEMLGILNE